MPHSTPTLPKSLVTRVFCVVAAWVVASAGLRGADPELEAGSALIQSFGLRDYHAHSEVWATAQDGRGVLYWIAHGKTNPEIAIILNCALNTVKKHVTNVLPKLGIETRLAAALRAVEILGLPSVDPARLGAGTKGTVDEW